MPFSTPLCPPIALLRSNDVCFLGIARGLAAAGTLAQPITFDWQGAKPWYSERSLCLGTECKVSNPYEYPKRAGEELVRTVSQLASTHKTNPLLLGSSDTNLMFMLDNQNQLAPITRNMGSVDFTALRGDVIRKDTCAELLRRGGVAIPQTFRCTSLRHIDAIVQEVSFPCIYKPLEKDYGQTFQARHDGCKAIEVESPEQLRSALTLEIGNGFKLLVQEKVFFSGPREEIPFYLYADKHHKIRMAATAIKETIQPHPFGTATVLRLSHHPELLPLAQQVASALKWRGILMIEFIRDEKDLRWKVIEVNARPWLFVDFFRRSGLNYLGYLKDDLTGTVDGWPDICVPSPEALAASHVHVDLPTACEPFLAQFSSPQVEHVVEFLAQIPGSKSLTYLDPNDPEPGLAQLRDLATRWQLNDEDLTSAITKNIGHY